LLGGGGGATDIRSKYLNSWAGILGVLGGAFVVTKSVLSLVPEILGSFGADGGALPKMIGLPISSSPAGG